MCNVSGIGFRLWVRFGLGIQSFGGSGHGARLVSGSWKVHGSYF